MQIKEIIQKRQNHFEAGDDAPHLRGKWVEATRQMLGKDQNGKEYTYGRINGLTRDWTIEKIRERYHYCVKQDRPAFVWWGMRKNEIKK